MNRQHQGDTLPSRRQAGVGLHITSLPGRFGIGEIGSQARRFVDLMARMELGVWQFLPTGPTAYGDSPYQPLSTFAGNEMLIDIGDLTERGFVHQAETRLLEDLPRHTVDYGTLIPAKTRILKAAAERFSRTANSALKSECDDFYEYNNDAWLHDYALFRILKNRHDERAWPEWEDRFVHRDEKALREIESSAAREIEQFKILQFMFHCQWRQFRDYANASGVKLFGDMPICIALDSADAWSNHDILQIDDDGRPAAVAGVPPDYFSADGQLWGNPLYAWDRHEATGYQWWVERLQASTDLADIVRIDHFRGFEAYWSVPADSATARDGTWITGPGDAIFDAMQKSLGQLPIVAEDLGVITPEVEALRDRHNIPGMVVLQFDAADEDFSLDDVPDNCVCYTGTHDNDTTLGWFRGSPDDIRNPEEIERTQRAALALTDGTPETIHRDLIRAALSTRARLAVAPLQDFLGLGSEARINTPGTSKDNWRWRVDATQLNDEFVESVGALVSGHGRARPQ